MIVRTILLFCWAALMFADVNGPDPGVSGIPGEAGTCANCHASGTSSINTKGGSVSLTLPKGTNYVPGEVQHWIVTIADSSARRWGFQAAARKATATSTLAGGFKS